MLLVHRWRGNIRILNSRAMAGRKIKLGRKYHKVYGYHIIIANLYINNIIISFETRHWEAYRIGSTDTSNKLRMFHMAKSWWGYLFFFTFFSESIVPFIVLLFFWKYNGRQIMWLRLMHLVLRTIAYWYRISIYNFFWG